MSLARCDGLIRNRKRKEGASSASSFPTLQRMPRYLHPHFPISSTVNRDPSDCWPNDGVINRIVFTRMLLFLHYRAAPIWNIGRSLPPAGRRRGINCNIWSRLKLHSTPKKWVLIAQSGTSASSTSTSPVHGRQSWPFPIWWWRWWCVAVLIILPTTAPAWL